MPEVDYNEIGANAEHPSSNALAYDNDPEINADPKPELTPEELAAIEVAKREKAKKRFAQIDYERHENKRLYDATQAELALAKRELEQLKAEQQKPDSKTDAAGAPDPAKYPAGIYDPDYIKASIKHEAAAHARQIFDEQQNKTKIESNRQRIDAIEAKALETHTDYREVLSDFLSHDLAKVPVFREIVQESDNPAELSYYLGKNPEELDKIAAMTPNQATRYIGRLEAKIAESPTTAAARTSDAPAPPTPIKGAQSSKVSTKDPEKMTMAEYAAWRKAGN